MSNLKKVVISCVTWILFLVLFLNILPLRRSAEVSPNTVFYASERTITIEKETTEAEWNLSKIMEIVFTLSGSIYGHNVTIPFEYELQVHHHGQLRVTRIEYEFLVNGKSYRNITDDTVGVWKYELAGSYERKPIPIDLLKVGENKVTLKVHISSMCDRASLSSFRLIIKDLRVENHLLDFDMDYIWDNVDQLPINNHVFTVFLSAITTPIVGYLSLTFRKTWKGKSLEENRNVARIYTMLYG